MDKINGDDEFNNSSISKVVIDNPSRALGDLADLFGNYLLEYVEEKAHYLLFKNEKKLKIK